MSDAGELTVAITRLTNAIDGLRADVRAAAVDTRALVSMQQATTRDLLLVFRDFREELGLIRTAIERAERLTGRMDRLERELELGAFAPGAFAGSGT